MIRRLLTAMAVLTVALLVVAPSANAQDDPGYPPGTCGFVLDPPVIALGGEVHIIGGGFEPGSTVTFEINGQFLGSVVVEDDIDGPIDVVFQVPTSLPDGEYIITTACDGNSFSQSVVVGNPALLCGIDIFFTGQTASLRLPSFQVNTAIVITLDPGSVQLYSGPVTGNPMMVDVMMPSNIVAGEYTINAVGTGIDGQPKTLICALQAQVTQPPAQPPLPITGSDGTMLLVRVGLALLTVGGLLFVLGRKRSIA